ncbi:MAG: choice-of-anchor D domain-containing protein [Deltaproteobacteria bacterium]|nr:choice-of-anchor D domain-containing protein [Deltaproteobacteria bacterium]
MTRLRVYFIAGASLFIAGLFYVSCLGNSPSVSSVSMYAEDDFLKNWKSLSPGPVSEDIFSVHSAGSAVVASLFGGRILYSDNAMMSLEFYDLPQTDVLADIADYNNYYVGVSSSGRMYKSSDGKVWSEVSGEMLNKPLTAVAAGNEVIAAGFGGLIISSANLSGFSKKTTLIQDNLYDIAVSDTNVYVAVGQNSTVCRSSDGIAFSCTKTSAVGDIVGVAYGNSKFIAVTSSGKFLVSSDYGATWTVSDLGFQGEISGIEYFNDEFIIYGFNGLIATSKTGNSFGRLNVNSAYNFHDVTYDGSLYYFVGPGGLVLTSSSPSGEFLKISPDIAGDLFALYKGNDYYIAGGRGGTIAYSDDGVNFSPAGPNKISNDIKSIASDKAQGNERFCAVASGGFVYRTQDVTGDWTGYNAAGTNDLNDITFALSKFILAGNNGALYISGDCSSFLKIDTGSSANFSRVLFDGTNIFVAGSGGTLYKSVNPSGPYSKVNFPASYNITDIAYGNGIYLLLTQEKVSETSYNSRIYKSADMNSFSLVKEYPNIRFTRVAFGGGYFIFTNSLGYISYTKDGQNFMTAGLGRYKEILNAQFLEKSFYLSGKDGLLMKSNDNTAGLEPQITVSVNSINFGDVVVNSSSQIEEIGVSNTGKGNLSISSVIIKGKNSNQYLIVADSCSTATLPAGNECRIYVDFRPTSTGSKSAVIEINSNDRTTPVFCVSLSGRGITPTAGAISTDRGSIDFGLVKLGNESSPEKITVKNVGSKNLEISDVSIGGNDTSDFVIKSENCKGITLAPNNTCVISLSFKPLSLGDRSAELQIDSDDPNKPVAKVLLAGSGIDKDYPNIEVDNNQIDFGTVKVGTESPLKSLTVSNKGSSGLLISDVRTEGMNSADFVIKSDGCKGKSLTPSSSCKIDIVFKPQNQGNSTSSLKIVSNDPDTPNYSVNLYGTGRAAGGPAINVSPVSLDFGKINSGTESAAQDVIITSVGDKELAISAQTITGNDSTNFGIKGTDCPLKLAVNQSCRVSVVFAPKGSGARSASLEISSDDPLYPKVNVALKGEGVLNKPSDISVTPSSYDFGRKIIGKVYPPVTFTVKNEGTGNLIIGSVGLDGNDKDAFKIESDDCSGNQFSQDGLCYIRLGFRPDEEKLYSVSLVINSNDAVNPRLDVPVKGEGITEQGKDTGGTSDSSVADDSGIAPSSDIKSGDTSESGCGCSIVE